MWVGSFSQNILATQLVHILLLTQFFLLCGLVPFAITEAYPFNSCSTIVTTQCMPTAYLQCFRLRNDLYCVGLGVKLYSLTHLQCK